MSQNIVAGTKAPKYAPTTPEEYLPMEVPDHIYVAGVERKPVQKEVRPQMVVPSRITVEGGDKTAAAKAQPTEVIRERQVMMSNASANELPSGDFQRTPVNIALACDTENPTSIAVEKNPLEEIKQLRRRINILIRKVDGLEMDIREYKYDRPYVFAAGFILTGLVVFF
uniref:Zonular occludens toxin n=1 Tax=Meloidogyne hapla TaxID=6305 RepID=A0A1I8BQT0_MELHA